MADNIQTRIREYLRGENDEDHRKLLRDAVDELDRIASNLETLHFDLYGKAPAGRSGQSPVVLPVS